MPTKTTASPRKKATAKSKSATVKTPAGKPAVKKTTANKSVARTATKAAKPTGKGLSAITKIKDMIVQSLDADKAEDIVSYDLVGRSSLADYMVIASGKSGRQVTAMAEHLRDKLTKEGKKPSIEGLDTGDWVLVDTGDVIVHLFRPEVREFYQIESLWAPEAIGASRR